MSMMTCGYCETQNRKDNQCCIACGGSLVDEISRKANPGTHSKSPVSRSGIRQMFGLTVNEAHDSLRQVFG